MKPQVISLFTASTLAVSSVIAEEGSATDSESAPPVTPASEETVAPVAPDPVTPEPEVVTPSKVEEPAPVVSAPVVEKKKEPQKYVIKSGDNPWLIAKNYSVSLDELLKINDIKDPKDLKIGDVLVLPSGAKSGSDDAPKFGKSIPAAPATTTTETEPQAGDDWELYTIKSGDNPWKIAKKLKLDHQKIIQLNESVNFTNLKIGQQIKIPKG